MCIRDRDKVTGFTASKEALAFLLRQLTDIKNEVPDEDGILSLIHICSFMEKFYYEGYEEELVASLKRKPTEYTIALMFRILADKENPNLSEYKHLLKTLDSTSEIDTFWLDEIAKL